MLMHAAMLLLLMITPGRVRGAHYTIGGKALSCFGYITQSVMYGLGSDRDFDTERGLQSVLTTILIEGEYRLSAQLKLFASGVLASDRIYDIKHDDSTWAGKGFNRSRSELSFDDEYWQLLKELHVTWTAGRFYLRAGKQIVSWGETIGIRLMDRINPLDQRRGFADVEFETTIIPVWLVRAEYYPDIVTAWLSDVGIECVFNPNADFIPGQPIEPGNDAGGIWAPYIPLGTAGGRRLVLGSLRKRIDEPRDWGSEGFELAVRIKALMWNSIVTLNYFNGVENDYVTAPAGGTVPVVEKVNDDILALHPAVCAYYPDLRFAGVTVSSDVQALRIASLGDVSPVFRLEALYAFDSTFSTDEGPTAKRDEIRWAAGMDWKIKIRALNPRAYIRVSPQFFHRRIQHYPDHLTLTDLKDDNYTSSLYISTSYMNARLVPSVFWLRDYTQKADMLRLQIEYYRSHNWLFKAGIMLFSGSRRGKSFRAFANKDHVYLSVSYRWG